MTVSKSQAPSSSSSSHLSILSTHPHPHPHLHPHQLKNSALACASVTKTTVDTRSTMDAFPSMLKGSGGEKSSGVSSKNPSSWDPQDDILLRHLKEVKKLGWKDISQYFNNRTPNACQFRWRRLKSGNLKSNKTAHIDVSDFPSGNKLKKESSSETQIDIQGEKNVNSPHYASGVSGKSSLAIPIPNLSANGSNVSKGVEFKPQVQSQLQPLTQSQSQPQSQSLSGNGSSNFSHSYSKSPYVNIHSTSNPPADLPNGSALTDSNGAGSKFFKARSNSHSFSKPFSSADEENIGFIPKIIVRSRRSSFAHPQVVSQPSSVNNSSSNLTSALNTTLNTIKSRKNSFTVRSRRSSFNVSSNTTSRRSSVVAAPNSLSGMLSINSGSSTPKIPRRDSVAVIKELGNNRASTPSFIDLPASSLPPHFHRRASRSHFKQRFTQPPSQNGSCVSCNPQLWSAEEDKLLSENGSRNLSLMELSILLPNRTEKEIQWRIDTLSSENSPKASQGSSHSPLHSPRKSVSPEETAIDEDNCDTCDEADNANNDDEDIDPLNHSHSHSHSPHLMNESSPCSIISSTTTNEIENDRHASIDSNLSNHIINHNHHDHEYNENHNIKTFRTQSHPNVYIPSRTATPLPGINAILKGTL
ncbi:hypothetical protein HG535_0A08110 [Zygotorulaspora mrakii]|uniref:Uncharacterized protein n=1 Tax=Zygotorulaspora mrakii TaxID=42260 RepID=A0A7H9AX31_ZYGMR|nr:uncharacterized protein HG535_0A08110 [Zygotorulaspora mrakii]QLG70866.1 hypothetical protein HG535_0A08110 [Zygotorulaspora mrakii]